MGPTPFLESNALLAMQLGDVAEASEILDKLLPNELTTLSDAAYSLHRMCEAKRWGTKNLLGTATV